MDCELQYHARMDLQRKHVRAVKRMVARLHCREIIQMVPFRASVGLFTLARICPAALCRRGTARPAQGFFNISQASRTP
jgi:hypothetical protein